MAAAAWILGSEELRHKWGWFLALGIVLLLLGIGAVALTPVATLAAVMVLGWLMVFSGIVEAVHAFQVHRWGGFFLHLIGGVLGVLIGLLIVTHPGAGALAWTLLFASFFTVIGLFRLIRGNSSAVSQLGLGGFRRRNHITSGCHSRAEWPWSGLWFLGLSVGISLLLRGWSYVMLAVAIRRFPGCAG